MPCRSLPPDRKKTAKGELASLSNAQIRLPDLDPASRPKLRSRFLCQDSLPLEVDVRAVRAATGLSRAEFARCFALDPRALQDWEQGRRRPDRAARAYLTVIARHPEAVVEALAS